jgi:hypothetical protein
LRAAVERASVGALEGDMDQVSSLLRAIAAIAWPTLGFVVLALFHREIRQLVARLKRGKILGQELELAELQALDAQATKARAQLPPPVEAAPATVHRAPDVREQVLAEAQRSPKIALLLLQAEIEKAARELLASLGSLGSRKAFPLPEMIRKLRNDGYVPTALIRSAEAFLGVRNKIVHGRSSTEDDILSAIDSGLTILEAIGSVPHETNIVAYTGVTGYADAAGQREQTGFKVILLDTRGADGTSVRRRAFPTTRADFVLAKPVSWEWDLGHVYPETWYRDPDSGKVEYGWTESAEFVGRSFDHL